MTHASVAGTELEVPADLIRLSVGIEDVEDLIADLEQALDRLALTRAARLVPARSASTSGRPSPRRCSSTRDGRARGDRAPRRRRSAPTSWTAPTPCARELAAHGAVDEVLACSSAGGGLRLAVVGYEREVTAAGRAPGRPVAPARGSCTWRPGRCPAPTSRALRGSRPDLVLLVGGTDGGNAEVLLHNAARLAKAAHRRARSSWPATPTRADEVAAAAARRPGGRSRVADNVLPRSA